MRKFGLLTAAAMAATFPVAPAMAQAPGEETAVYDISCDRECLLSAVRAYIDALRAKNPHAAPLADNVTFTENNVVLPIGKGLWATVTDVDQVGLEAADPLTRNAAWFGSVRENGEPAIFAARIRVTNGRIDEIETVVHRRSGLPAPFGDVENMVHDPAFNEILPPEQRRSRERLRAIADQYFNTVEVNDGQVLAPFDMDCGRLENAISTTSRVEDGAGESEFVLVDGCEAQFELGIYRINKRIRERLYPLIDEERGVVVASGFFDHANEWDRYLLTDGREMRTALKWPNSITLLEAFRIKDAKIHRIEAVFTYVPYFMHNPWAGPDSSPPRHPVDPAACDAACLTGLAQQVMAAYPTRGWNSLNWADKVGYSENSVGLQVGEGIWGSTTAVGQDPLIMADAQTGKALWVGRIEAHGQPSWAAITVQAAGDKIGAVDAVIRRMEYGAPFAEPTVGPAFSELPAAQRMARADMLAAVDRYYEAVARKDGAAPKGLASDCERVLNGETVSTCAQPFTARLFQPLEQVRDRSVIAVDEARGLVAVSAYEDYPASQQEFTDASGNTFRDALPYPRTQQVVELFRFENGQLVRIVGYHSELPLGMKPRD